MESLLVHQGSLEKARPGEAMQWQTTPNGQAPDYTQTSWSGCDIVGPLLCEKGVADGTKMKELEAPG